VTLNHVKLATYGSHNHFEVMNTYSIIQQLMDRLMSMNMFRYKTTLTLNVVIHGYKIILLSSFVKKNV